jgi:hypothetical protein
MIPSEQPVHLLIVGGALLLLVVIFIAFFLVPGVLHAKRLRGVRNQLRSVGARPKPEVLRVIFTSDQALAHLWSEYEETLHQQTGEKDGRSQVIAIRSTVPASAFFNGQYVVDTRLSTEFFKHLPGIFTGLGIIGTFSGLISGLDQFEVSSDATTARESLATLLNAVGEAFLVSAAAITAAMIVTFIEKLLINFLYRQTEKIAHAVDACFESGSGDEYLARLVKAAENTASQSMMLKDAIVNELRELTDRQIAGVQRANEELSKELRGPLIDISGNIGGITKDTSSAAVKLLGDVMADFSARLNELFGSQIKGIKQGNQETILAMQEAVRALHSLIGNMEDSSKRSSEALAARLADAVGAMEDRQRNMNDEANAFIEQIRSLMRGSQAETQLKLQEALSSLDKGMQTILVGLHEEQASFTKNTGAAVERVTGSVNEAVQMIAGASDRMVGSMDKLSNVTRGAVEGMESSAERIIKAATTFVHAGESVRDVMSNTAKIGSQLNELHGSLTVSARSLSVALNDYKEQRTAIQALGEQVRTMLEGARREASITEDILQRIERSAQRLNEAQDNAETYIKGINQVLSTSSQSFQNAVRDSLDTVNRDFHTKLSEAVSLLAGAIDELESALSSVTPKK